MKKSRVMGHESRGERGSDAAPSPLPRPQSPSSNHQSSILNTPLAATAGVVFGMAALAIPLLHLTSKETPAKKTSVVVEADARIPCWLTLKLLAPANYASLKSTNGELLWSSDDLAANEIEARKPLPIGKAQTDFILEVEFSDPAQESAAFLNIAPDGLEEVTEFLIGSGSVRKVLSFSWPNN